MTDIDDRLVSDAHTRLADDTNVTVDRADVTCLPYEERSFDAVLSHLMLHHVIDWPGALQESARVLRSGGLFVGYDLTDTYAARLMHHLDRSPHQLLTAHELRKAMARAGFCSVTVQPSAGNHVMRFSAISCAM